MMLLHYTHYLLQKGAQTCSSLEIISSADVKAKSCDLMHLPISITMIIYADYYNATMTSLRGPL